MVRSGSREIDMHRQLARVRQMRVLPLISVLREVTPGLSALVLPCGETLLNWVADLIVTRDVLPAIVELVKVRHEVVPSVS